MSSISYSRAHIDRMAAFNLAVVCPVLGNWHEFRLHLGLDLNDHGPDLFGDVVVVTQHLAQDGLPFRHVQWRLTHLDSIS